MLRLFLALLILFGSGVTSGQDKPIIVASKNFNESYLLAEIMSQLLEIGGFSVERKFGLGGTLVCYEALASG